MSEFDDREGIEAAEIPAQCDCGTQFLVPESLRGGISPCPACGKLVSVSPPRETVFYALVGCAVAIVVAVSGLIGWFGGLTAGLITLAIGGAAVLLVTMMS